MKRQKPIPAFLPPGLRAYRERGGGINRGSIGNFRWRLRVVSRHPLPGGLYERQRLGNGADRIVPVTSAASADAR